MDADRRHTRQCPAEGPEGGDNGGGSTWARVGHAGERQSEGNGAELLLKRTPRGKL